MSDVTDARQCLPAEAVGTQLTQILERLDLGSGEALAEDGQVRFLVGRREVSS